MLSFLPLVYEDTFHSTLFMLQDMPALRSGDGNHAGAREIPAVAKVRSCRG